MKKFFFIGGDNRNLILSKLFENDGFECFRIGFGKEDNISNVYEGIIKSDIIILPMPVSMDSKS